jgi:hypothetical protein
VIYRLIRGRVDGVEMEIYLPDETSPDEAVGLIRRIQDFVNQFETLEDFHDEMSRVALGIMDIPGSIH